MGWMGTRDELFAALASVGADRDGDGFVIRGGVLRTTHAAMVVVDDDIRYTIHGLGYPLAELLERRRAQRHRFQQY